jgi:hypothetical protein
VAINDNVTNPAATPDRFAAAHDALRADPAFQYRLTAPDPPPEPPKWLQALLEWLGEALAPVGRFFAWIGSFFPDAYYVRLLLWAVLAAAVLAIFWAAYKRIRFGHWRLRRPQQPLIESSPEEEDWMPEVAGVRSWLDEADALAREGLYGEAVHHLLFRSIEDISKRRPNAVHPALTSREIAASPAIPTRVRSLFTNIARLVERSLFGRRSVAKSDWLEARQSYADLAMVEAWRA